MGLYHTEDQAMLKDSVVPFLAENGSIKQLRSLRDSNDATGFARDLWSQFAEMGLNGILIPEAEGGLGLGDVDLVVFYDKPFLKFERLLETYVAFAPLEQVVLNLTDELRLTHA